MTSPSSGRLGLRDALDVIGLAPSYVALGLLKHTVSLPRLAAWAWRDGAASAGDGRAGRVDRVVRAVVRLSTHLPFRDRDCLQRSLVLYRELSKEGATPTLVLGFSKEPDGVRGHAWVEIQEGGRSVMPEDVSRFVTTMRFGPGGQLSAGEPTAPRA